MYRRDVIAALAAGVLLSGCGGGASVVQAADAPAVRAESTAKPGRHGEPGSGNGEAGEDGAPAYEPDDPFVGSPAPDVPARTIVVQGFRFWPEGVLVRPGQKWTFDNRDIAIHRLVTQGDGARTIDSGDLAPGDTTGSAGPPQYGPTLRTIPMPQKPGTYEMTCAYHGGMSMRITVK